jgi:hypothetical protein
VRHQLSVGRVVLPAEEGLLTAVAALGHVVRDVRDDHSRCSGHVANV